MTVAENDAGENGPASLESSGEQERAKTLVHVCPLCNKCFASAHALRVHKASTHKALKTHTAVKKKHDSGIRAHRPQSAGLGKDVQMSTSTIRLLPGAAAIKNAYGSYISTLVCEQTDTRTHAREHTHKLFLSLVYDDHIVMITFSI